jgi:ATP-dependent helicase HepA
MAIGNLVAVPELQADGPAHLISQKQGFLRIRFLRTGAVMTQESKRVVRYLLFPGTRIAWEEDGRQTGEILARTPKQDGGRSIYPVRHDDGQDWEVDEGRIREVQAPTDPCEQLAQVAFHDVRPRFGRSGSPMPPDPWGPLAFCAREALLRYRDRTWAMSNGILGLAGARIQALPHQLLVARQVLADRQIRFLLADEVGLGKTIEAGLIMQSLLAMQPRLRVLVVAPGALVSQWFLECFIKFGGRRFTMLDSERIKQARDNPWQDQFVLISSHALETLSGKERIRFASSSWDLLIVDECHRMQPGGRLYRQVSTLSKRVPHVLLLSATPGRQHPDAYLALLALLQPDVYQEQDLDGFRVKMTAHDQVLALCERSLDADIASWPAIAADWQQLLGADGVLAGLLEQIAAADAAAFLQQREALLAYIREHYQLDHRVISNRRQVLARLSETTGISGLALGARSVEWVRYQPDEAEIAVRQALVAYRRAVLSQHPAEIPPRVAHWLLQVELACWTHPRILDRLLAMRAAVLEEPEEYEEYRRLAEKGEGLTQVLRTDFSEAESSTHIAVSAASHPGGLEEEDALDELRAAVSSWSPSRCARLKAVVERIRTFWRDHPGEKLLIFVGHGSVVTLIAEALSEALGQDRIETFGAHQDALEREEAARRFRELDRVSILVSDPLGGEGRNFQFVSVVVHYDLPWSIAAVEQRIGRVDRLGRDGEVPSWVCCSDQGDALDAVWAQVLHQAIGVFENSSSGLEFISGTIEEQALQTALVSGASGLQAELEQYCALVEAERQARDEREDHLLSKQEDDFVAMAELASRSTALDAPVRAVCNWLRGLGGQVRRDDDGARPFKLRTRHADDFEEGVFARELALQHERYAYFAQGHDIIDRLLADAGAADWCRAGAWRRKPTAEVKRWEGVRVSYDWQLDFQPLIAAELPLETLRRLFRVVAPHRERACFRFDEEQGTVVEEDLVILELLRPDFGECSEDATLSPRTSREFWMRPVLQGKAEQVFTWQQRIRAAGAVVVEHGQRRWQAVASDYEAALEQAFSRDLAVLQGQVATTEQRLGVDHPDSRRLLQELEADQAVCDALRASLAGATLQVSGMAYMIVA